MFEQKNFTGTINVVEASRANDWLKSGIAIFVSQRKTWMLMMLCLVAFSFLSMTLSIFGLLALKVLMPVFLAGTMQCCVLLEQHKPVSVSTLFDGFQNQFPNLLRIGLLYACLHLLGMFVLAWYIAASADPLFLESLEKVSDAVAQGAALDLTMLVPPSTSVLLKSAILWVFLSVPALMLLCFSPLLTRLYGVHVYTSIRTSFAAVWMNRSAFFTLLLSLLFLVLVFLLPILVLMFILKLMQTAVAPLLVMTIFFITMLIIRPILIAAIYAAHKDIFDTGVPKNDVLMA